MKEIECRDDNLSSSRAGNGGEAPSTGSAAIRARPWPASDGGISRASDLGRHALDSLDLQRNQPMMDSDVPISNSYSIKTSILISVFVD
jgi:hypothetical protein